MNNKRAKRLKRKLDLGAELYLFLVKIETTRDLIKKEWFYAMYRYYRKRLLTEGYIQKW